MPRTLVLLPLLGACTGSFPWEDEEEVFDRLEVIATREDGLRRPQDLAFDPQQEGALWVVNQQDDSTTILVDAGTLDQNSKHVIDPYALHFMDQVSSISFGAPGLFATCQDSRNDYNHTDDPNDFMGPALWTSNLEVYGQSNPDAVRFLTESSGFPTDLGSHLDMLHQSPLCVGIAWETDNVYWVFDGLEGSIVRYDFQEDHGPGFDDHSDGIIARYAIGDVERVRGSVAGMIFHEATRELFVSDPGGGRIVALDVDSGDRGRRLSVTEAGTEHYLVRNADLRTVADAAVGLVQPAGLDLVEDHLVVADAGTGHILFLDLEGKLVADLDTGLGPDRLAGLYARALDDLWIVDPKENRVLRIMP